MYSLLKIIYFSIDKILSSLQTPIYWVVVLIVFLQYKKVGKMEREILGKYKKSPFWNTIISTFYGLVGGIIGSIISVYFNVSINQRDFLLILPLAIILSVIHPRFICYSYAGGIISLISLILGWPKINVTGIMYIVGILHLAESLLILLDGINSKMPIFTEKEGQLVGGFFMNRFWPVPFTIFVENGFIYPVTILAILGYGDFSLSSDPALKSRRTSGLLLTFSIILILFAKISADSIVFKYIAAVFSPIAHEFIIMLGKNIENKGEYIYTPAKHGLKVLDIIPGSIGEKIGLNPGDIILSINGRRIFTKEDIEEALYFRPKCIIIDVYDINRGFITKRYDNHDNVIDSLGVIIVPDTIDYSFQIEESESIGIRLMKRHKKRKSTFRN